MRWGVWMAMLPGGCASAPVAPAPSVGEPPPAPATGAGSNGAPLSGSKCDTTPCPFVVRRAVAADAKDAWARIEIFSSNAPPRTLADGVTVPEVVHDVNLVDGHAVFTGERRTLVLRSDGTLAAI